MGRLLALYLRCRHVPIAGPAAVVATVGVALLGDNPQNPLETLDFAMLSLALGFSVLGNGFSGADEQLDRTTSIPWPVWRTAHVVLALVMLFGAVVLVSHAPSGVLLRDAAGFAGLTALAATLFGGQLSWTLPIAWAGVAAVVPPMSPGSVLALITWPTQAPDSAGALVLAIVLGVLGVACYAAKDTLVNRTWLR